MKKEITTDDVLDLLEKPILAYIQSLMSKTGMEINKGEAENILSNVGMRVFKRKIIK
mgnify:CR=1 FL=1